MARAKPAAQRPENVERMITPRIGAEWPGQGGVLLGIVKGLPGQPDYCLVKPPGIFIKGKWGPLKNVKAAESEFDGMANTLAMRDAGSEIASRATLVECEGHRDYYIASRREARIAFANCSDAYQKEWHWTSTQDAGLDSWAWLQSFYDGYQHLNHKDDEYPVVLVRRVPIR